MKDLNDLILELDAQGYSIDLITEASRLDFASGEPVTLNLSATLKKVEAGTAMLKKKVLLDTGALVYLFRNNVKSSPGGVEFDFNASTPLITWKAFVGSVYADPTVFTLSVDCNEQGTTGTFKVIVDDVVVFTETLGAMTFQRFVLDEETFNGVLERLEVQALAALGNKKAKNKSKKGKKAAKKEKKALEDYGTTVLVEPLSSSSSPSDWNPWQDVYAQALAAKVFKSQKLRDL